MYSVGVRELKNRLSHYLRSARQGERLIITERGKPIAVLYSLDDMEAPSGPELELARLVKEGVVRLPRKKFARGVRRVTVSGPPVSEAVIEARR